MTRWTSWVQHLRVRMISSPPLDMWDQQQSSSGQAGPDSLARAAAEEQLANSWEDSRPGYEQSGFEAAAVKISEGEQGDGWGEDGWGGAEGSWENGGDPSTLVSEIEPPGMPHWLPAAHQIVLDAFL